MAEVLEDGAARVMSQITAQIAEGEMNMKGTIMLESGLAEVTVVQVDGADARVRDNDGEEYWVAWSDVEVEDSCGDVVVGWRK
jgi:hypothetical protein